MRRSRARVAQAYPSRLNHRHAQCGVATRLSLGDATPIVFFLRTAMLWRGQPSYFAVSTCQRSNPRPRHWRSIQAMASRSLRKFRPIPWFRRSTFPLAPTAHRTRPHKTGRASQYHRVRWRRLLVSALSWLAGSPSASAQARVARGSGRAVRPSSFSPSRRSRTSPLCLSANVLDATSHSDR